MATVVFFDCESDCTLRSCPGTGNDRFKHCQCTVACALEIDADQAVLAVHNPDTIERLVDESNRLVCWRDVAMPGQDPYEPLLRIFDRADVIVAYNGLDFDFPLLRKHYGNHATAQERYLSHRLKCLDSFAQIRSHTATWPKLDALLKHNHVDCKLADGMQAIQWWADQQRDKLREYCMKDVELMAKLLLLKTIHAPDVGPLPNSVFGVASFVLAQRASRALYNLTSQDHEWEVVPSATVSPESA